jgi:hypothetical protein
MKSTFYSGLWRAALLGSQQVLALPVSDYMVVEQLEGHGLVDIAVLIQRSGDDSELGTRQETRGPHN